MTEITKSIALNVKSDVLTKLAQLGVEYGLRFDIESTSYNSQLINFKLTANVEGVKTQKDVLFDMMVKQEQLTTEERNGRKLIEYNARSPKYPWIFRMNGKNYKCDIQSARVYFKL